MPPLNIAICGFGSAGRSRLKAMGQVEGIACAGIISRRLGIGTYTFEQALQNPDIGAMAISTENTDHSWRVREALNHHKHVLCDYPLAFTKQAASELFEIAKRNKLVLHVEHIGLLSQNHLKAKNDFKTLGEFINGEYLFTGGWNESLARTDIHGPPVFWCLSRLMQLADWLGVFQIVQNNIIHDAQNCVIDLILKFKTGEIHFIEKREVGLKRGRSFKAHFELGDYDWQATVGDEGLFAQDLIYFRDRILKGIPCYYNETLMLDVLGQLQNI